MIITCKSHGMNLIGVSKFRNKPKKALDVYQTLLPFWDGSGDETNLVDISHVNYQECTS